MGPNVVVAYEPGSVVDLCVLWDLRAANGWGHLPLGVPSTEDVPGVIREWSRSGAGYGRGNPGVGPGMALVDASVDLEDAGLGWEAWRALDRCHAR